MEDLVQHIQQKLLQEGRPISTEVKRNHAEADIWDDGEYLDDSHVTVGTGRVRDCDRTSTRMVAMGDGGQDDNGNGDGGDGDGDGGDGGHYIVLATAHRLKLNAANCCRQPNLRLCWP